jgi:hypothetical protein
MTEPSATSQQRKLDLDKVFMPMGANFGDMDNDGFLDIYLGTVGQPSFTASLVPNVLLSNNDGKYFTDITQSSGTGELHKGHGIAFADLSKRSSYEDIIAEIGGATPADKHTLRVFENPGNTNDWLNVQAGGREEQIDPLIGAQDQDYGGRRTLRATFDLSDCGADKLLRCKSRGAEHRARAGCAPYNA